MITDVFTPDFLQKLLLAVTTIGLGGLALWTWQRMYWEYQLRRQREDWVLRQCYARRDSQRTAMENLLIEMNEALENFVSATLLSASAMERYSDYVRKGGTEEGIKKWKSEVDRSVDEFNQAESDWLVKSRLVLGKLSFLFSRNAEEFEGTWNRIIQKSEGTCTLFHDPETTYRHIWDSMLALRNQKNQLVDVLQREIDRFVSMELEPEKQE